MCSNLLPSGYVRVMQLVCSILLHIGYVGAVYVLKIRNSALPYIFEDQSGWMYVYIYVCVHACVRV